MPNPIIRRALTVPPLNIKFISGLALWLKSDEGVIIDTSSNSTTVSQWRDLSGKDRHATQITKTRQPQLLATKEISFNNSHFLVVNTAEYAVKHAFCVFRNLQNPFSDYNGFFTFRTAPNSQKSAVSNENGGFTGITGKNAIFDNGENSTSVRINRNNVSLSNFKNFQTGILISGTKLHLVSYTALSSVSGNKSIVIGADTYLSSGRFLTGNLKEIILFESVLSASVLEKIENYLAIRHRI